MVCVTLNVHCATYYVLCTMSNVCCAMSVGQCVLCDILCPVVDVMCQQDIVCRTLTNGHHSVCRTMQCTYYGATVMCHCDVHIHSMSHIDQRTSRTSHGATVMCTYYVLSTMSRRECLSRHYMTFYMSCSVHTMSCVHWTL